MLKMKKIVFFANSYFPRLGGVERHLYELISELSNRGYSIYVFVRGNNESRSKLPIESNVIIKYYKASGCITSRLNLLLLLVQNWKLFRSCQLIHFHDYSSLRELIPISYFVIRHIWKKRLFITFHGWEGIFPIPKKIIDIRKKCEAMVDGNMCIGDYLKKWYYVNPNIVSYGAVFQKIEETESTDGSFLFVGRLCEDTGIKAILSAWSKIEASYKEHSLIICGDGVLRKELEDAFSELVVKGRLIFKGFVSDPFKYLKKAEIVFASGYLSILEAFTMKKPVISYYDNPLKKDYLEMMPGSHKMMWICSSSEDIALAIKDALVDKRKRQNAYKFARRHSWARLADDYERLWALDHT